MPNLESYYFCWNSTADIFSSIKRTHNFELSLLLTKFKLSNYVVSKDDSILLMLGRF